MKPRVKGRLRAELHRRCKPNQFPVPFFDAKGDDFLFGCLTVPLHLQRHRPHDAADVLPRFAIIVRGRVHRPGPCPAEKANIPRLPYELTGGQFLFIERDRAFADGTARQ